MLKKENFQRNKSNKILRILKEKLAKRARNQEEQTCLRFQLEIFNLLMLFKINYYSNDTITHQNLMK